MADLGIPVIQINFHHSKSVSAILVRNIVKMQIALILEPWLNNFIKSLSCGTVFKPNTQNKIRTCVAVKGLNAIFMPQFNSRNITVVQLRINHSEDQCRVSIGSDYMTPRTYHRKKSKD